MALQLSCESSSQHSVVVGARELAAVLRQEDADLAADLVHDLSAQLGAVVAGWRRADAPAC